MKLSPESDFEGARKTLLSSGDASVDSKGHCCHFPSQDPQNNLFAEAMGFTAEPAKEFSRQRLRRRRQTAAKVLRGESPRPGENKDQKRGRWYPVTACGCVPHSGEMALHVRASGRVDRFGILRCGSVWTCPECAQRIASHRGMEIKAVIEKAKEQGFRVEMLTFTLPHELSLSFEICFVRLKEALRSFSSDGTVARRLRDVGFMGQVRAIEVTYGFTSGWHVHAHSVMVFEGEGGTSDTSAKGDFSASLELKKELYPAWKRAAHRAGATTPSFKHGFDVRAVWSGNDYLAKLPEAAKLKEEAGKPRWGADAELSKSYMKEGRKNSLAVWEILDQAANSAHFAQLFREYSAATWGRSQIEWSRGKRNLRAIFLDQTELLSDEELAVVDPEWVFADETDLPEVGQENLVVEQVLIASRDAWRARLYRCGSIDRACAAVEGGDALSLAEQLAADGWHIEEVCALGYASELREDQHGIWRKHTTIASAQYVATWPEGGAK